MCLIKHSFAATPPSFAGALSNILENDWDEDGHITLPDYTSTAAEDTCFQDMSTAAVDSCFQEKDRGSFGFSSFCISLGRTEVVLHTLDQCIITGLGRVCLGGDAQ
jgi:hypothetical protein